MAQRSSRLGNGRGFRPASFFIPQLRITTLAGASPLFSGDSVTRGDALARTVMQLLHPALASGEGHIHYSLLRRHAFPFCTAMGDIRSHNRPR